MSVSPDVALESLTPHSGMELRREEEQGGGRKRSRCLSDVGMGVRQTRRGQRQPQYRILFSWVHGRESLPKGEVYPELGGYPHIQSPVFKAIAC